jgi:CheY-like chemotaxis protein
VLIGPTVADPRRDKTKRAMIGRRCALVAGADPSIRQLLRTLLEIGGFEVVEAASDDELYAVLERGGRTPQVVVLDVLLPTFSAIHALSIIRDDQRLTTVPVVVLTSFADPPEQARFVQRGATAVLSKPFSSQRLLDMVSDIVTAN